MYFCDAPIFYLNTSYLSTPFTFLENPYPKIVKLYHATYVIKKPLIILLPTIYVLHY